MELEQLLKNGTKQSVGRDEAYHGKRKNLIGPDKAIKRNPRKRKTPWFNLDRQKLKMKLKYTCKALNKDPYSQT